MLDLISKVKANSCDDLTTPGSESLQKYCPTKSHNYKFGPLSAPPHYLLPTNSLASTTHQLINETVNADASVLHVYFYMAV